MKLFLKARGHNWFQFSRVQNRGFIMAQLSVFQTNFIRTAIQNWTQRSQMSVKFWSPLLFGKHVIPIMAEAPAALGSMVFHPQKQSGVIWRSNREKWTQRNQKSACSTETSWATSSWIGIISSPDSLVFHPPLKSSPSSGHRYKSTGRAQRNRYKRNNQTPWQDTQTLILGCLIVPGDIFLQKLDLSQA